ncbi:hypothetical protein HanIR_Chr16g0827041 [Helianthus annuus]|nr:hypothetical protein HanIR_Chr16g0827041 [Helianthus annuus]
MNESGSPDLKARRKDHMFPMKGQPKSPGGRLSLFFFPNFLSYIHAFIFFNPHFTTIINPNKIPT